MDRERLFSQNWVLEGQKWGLELSKIVSSMTHLGVSQKADHTWVTKLDYKISEYFELEAKKWGISLLSEENQHRELHPPMMIVDPVDGTRELINGNGEWSVSVALVESLRLNHPNNRAFLYSDSKKRIITDPFLGKQETGVGYVSRTEWEQGFYTRWPFSQYELKPQGSIAWKLALLSQGEIDFAVSLKPKSIWDIAAGSILLERKGYVFYSAGIKINELSSLSYQPPLFWGPASLWEHFSTWLLAYQQR